MAFEAFLDQAAARPTGRRRRLTYTLSFVIHGALLAAGVVYSFWHVEELSPPTVRVTFLSALPPPPPPPPPAGGGAPKHEAAPRPRVTPAIVQPKAALVQPREAPTPADEVKRPKDQPKKTDDQDEDEAALPGGVVGGKAGGTAGGTVGGTAGGTSGGAVDAPVAPKILAPNLGQKQKLSGDDPVFPAVLRRSGAQFVVMAKICVGKTGGVDSVTLMKRADPLLDANVESAVRSWRYSPLLAGGNTPVPFCYVARFEFKAD